MIGTFTSVEQKLFIYVVRSTQYNYLAYSLQTLVNRPNNSMQRVSSSEDAISSSVKKIATFVKHNISALFKMNKSLLILRQFLYYFSMLAISAPTSYYFTTSFNHN